MYIFNQFESFNIINIFTLIPFSVAIYMAFIGLGIRISISKLHDITPNYKNIRLVVLNNFLIIPSLITIVGLIFDLPPFMIIALLMISAGQGGKFSFITTFLMRGNTYSQFWHMICSSLLIIISLPLVLALFSTFNPSTKNLMLDIKVDYAYLFGDLIKNFLLPLYIGMGLRQLIPELAIFFANKLIFIGLLIIAIFIVIDHSMNFYPLKQYFKEYYYMLFAFNFCVFVITFSLPMALGYGYKNAVSIAIGSSQVNYFLIVTLLETYFNDYTMMRMTLLMWSLTSVSIPLSLGALAYLIKQGYRLTKVLAYKQQRS